VKQEINGADYRGKYCGKSQLRGKLNEYGWNNTQLIGKFDTNSYVSANNNRAKSAISKSYSTAQRSPRKQKFQKDGEIQSRNKVNKLKFSKSRNTIEETDFKRYLPEDYFNHTGYQYNPLLD
jgi:hypothetical protein